MPDLFLALVALLLIGLARISALLIASAMAVEGTGMFFQVAQFNANPC